MKSSDTSIGGPNSRFPTTRWSKILTSGEGQTPRGRVTREEFCRAYWKPAYAYIRRSWRLSSEDAKDLTQAFFARFLEKDYLARMQPGRGTFRGYLKRALQHFLIDARRSERTRRAIHGVVRLDAPGKDLAAYDLPSIQDTPEMAFEREWFRTVFALAIEDLRRVLEQSDKSVQFEVFRLYCLEPDAPVDVRRCSEFLHDESHPAPTYRGVAEKVGITEAMARNYLHHCRKTFQELLRARIGETVGSEEAVDRELDRARGS